jgi:hypothetical protein
MMNLREDALTRRTFVAISGAFFGGLFLPGGLEARAVREKGKRRHHGLRMYRWSGRGRRASRAALAHAANRRYALAFAARRDLPHPGAHLKLVRVDVSIKDFFRLFVSRRRLVVDLRELH